MDAILRDRLSLVAALGAGVVVGISGIYLYYKVNKCVTRELNHLSGTIDSLRREIEELKSSASFNKDKSGSSPAQKGNILNSTTVGSKYYSYTSSLEDADEEYFDFTDTEEVIGAWSTVNGADEDIPSESSLTVLLDELDALLDSDSSDKESMYFRLTSKKEEYSGSAEFLWRLAKVTHLYGIVVQARGEIEKRKQLAFEASNYAKMAYELDQQNPEVHKWYAITIGSLGDYVGTQEKIVNGYTFKEHVDKAISLKPSDPTLYYMLGRWCYEVAMLPWVQRKVASTLFSSPPEASLEEARAYLLKADKLKPNWKENLLFLAKTYIGEGDYSKAISVVDRALKIPVNSEDDSLSQNELEGLEYKYQTYRASEDD
ncbi:regulator of microtubule dynamics protein 1-like [Uloborus diversus]|uniref:regulator of microtubule dynamics protein 1-like n=1 Tax=Uloborus diversus TaxID=327109 RepID=UPI00240A0BF0|nr:regulator of microtubule dynamics protein 1-like [Uloborus diversus]